MTSIEKFNLLKQHVDFDDELDIAMYEWLFTKINHWKIHQLIGNELGEFLIDYELKRLSKKLNMDNQ